MKELEIPFDEAQTVIIKKKKQNRCKNCNFILHHEYSDRYNYCKKQHSNRTLNKLKSIKRNDIACHLFEPKKIN